VLHMLEPWEKVLLCMWSFLRLHSRISSRYSVHIFCAVYAPLDWIGEIPSSPHGGHATSDRLLSLGQ
jgi:hypothetical protein